MDKRIKLILGLMVCTLCLEGCSDNMQIEEKSSETISISSEKKSTSEDDIINPEEQKSVEVIPDQTEFVNIKDYIVDIQVDLKYSTTDNFTGQKIYEFTDAYLRYGTVEKLIEVQEALKEQDLFLKVWDAFRPVSAQFKLWEICPNSTYVANPNKGFSSHSRGNTVDITIVDKDGKDVVMPTGFDDFSTKADRDYSDCTVEARENAEMLEQLMIEKGFKAYYGEWWHFTDENEYPVEEEFLPSAQ